MLNRLRQFLPENSRQYREETSQRIAWGHWFALFNILLALVISSRYAFSADWPNTFFGKFYFFISLFGHFSFVIFAFYLLLLFPLSFLIKNERGFRGFSVIFATVGLTVLLVDTEVFHRFYLHLSPLVWDLLVNPDNGELSRQWQLLFVPMPLILLAEMLFSRWCWQKLRSFNRQKWGKYVALFFLTCFTATHLLYAWADMSLYRPITTQKANYPLSYPMTARSFLEKHGLIDRNSYEQQLEETGRLDAFYLDYPKSPLHFAKSTQQKPNLMIINLSGLRNDAISEQITPNLTQFEQFSRRFSHHYTAGDTAMAGIVSLFYSLSGKYVDSVLNEKTSSPLISSLQAADYHFGLFSHNGFREPIYHRALFAHFKLPKAETNREAINQWKNWLSQQTEQPYFSYLDLGLNQTSAHKLQNDEAGYYQQVQLVDWQFGEIWQALQQKGLSNTLVIVTADQAHTLSAEAENNGFSHEKIQVPLLVYWQGETGNYQEISSHLDLLPTFLARFFHVENKVSDYAQGLNLTTVSERKWVLAANRNWNVAIIPNGEQFHIDQRGNFVQFDAFDQKQKSERPPLALFLQLIQQSNQFIEN